VRSGQPDLMLPPLTAVVTSFVQEHLDPEHDPVEGMLGQVGSIAAGCSRSVNST
jgi:hypothetical protein